MYPSINPVLVRLGPLAVHWYGLTMTLAIFLGAFVASRFVSRRGGDSNVIWDMLLWVLIPALIGARLYFVFIQSPRGPNGINQYLANPIEILQVWRGGIHIYGALIFGGIALLLYLRVHKLPFARYLDGVALGLALGQAIGRIGNFINQELYGPPTTLPWGLRIDAAHRIPPYDNAELYPDGTRFHPLFLYEMTWDAIGFVLLLWISRHFAKQLRTGDIFLLYLIWIPLGRFFIEFLRTDSWFFPGTPFNTAHILTATAVLCGAVFLFLRHRNAPAIQQVVEQQSNQEHMETTIANMPYPSAIPAELQNSIIEPQNSIVVQPHLNLGNAPTSQRVTGQFMKPQAEQSMEQIMSEPTSRRVTGQFMKPNFIDARHSTHERLDALAQKRTETPVNTQDIHEHSEASTETPDNPQKGFTVLSNVGDTNSNVSTTDSIGIEHP